MTRFSANLGYLWTELTLPDAIRAAGSAGFDAVECHWPYDVASSELAEALDHTALEMLSINTHPGDVAAGEFGLSAVPGRNEEARSSIDKALSYATAIGAKAVHVLAGRSQGVEARQTFIDNLGYALDAAGSDTMLLIEPLNSHDVPGYFLHTTGQAQEIIEAINSPNLKLLFDCYHVGRTEGDVIQRLRDLQAIIGHIQFASVPDRGVPDHGELNYNDVFAQIEALGWTEPLGAEYRPVGPTSESLNWMAQFR